MEAIRREKLKALLEQALALPPEQRAAFLDEACTGDTALRDELDSLLDHAEEASAFFDSLAGAVLPQAQQQAPSPKKADGDPLGLIGRMVSHYQILEKIGGGGMGVVYKAHDTRLERPVALKFLPPHLSTDDESNARFVREAQAASALDHTNICTIHDIGQTDEGQFFIAMAYYQGETLKKKIARGALPINEALDYAVQMAEGLSRAHEAGIVHRDIKPANVMVTKDGVVKIVDFGLAKLTGAVELTKTGMTLGTLVYMSPEQIHGDVVDHRTDIWSWGVVVYEMLTGERPFKGHYEQALVYSILNESPLPPTEIRDEIPGDIGRITLKGLRKDRGDRYGSAGQLVSDLKAVQRALEGKKPAGLVAEKPAPKKESSLGRTAPRSPKRDFRLCICWHRALPTVRFFARLLMS